MTFIKTVATLGSALMLILALAPVSRAQTPYGSVPHQLTTQVGGEKVTGDEATRQPSVIEGQVAAASESGELLLRTDRGMVAFLVPPEEIKGVSIGERVQVPLSDDDSD